MNIKKHIPNSITCCNLLSGAISIYFAIGVRDLETAYIFIVISAVFDFFDGLAARALKVSSPIGKDLDSLADNVSFGLAPAMLIFSYLTNRFGNVYLSMPVFILSAFAALRLAKFNNDTRQTCSFIGLAVPSNALFWIGYTSLLHDNYFRFSELSTYTITFLFVILFSYLMVSELPMFSLKKNKDKGKEQYIAPFILLISSIILISIMGFSGLAFIVLIYISICVLMKIREK